MKDKDILILYLEDYQYVLDTGVHLMRKFWSQECIGARSRERGLEILDEWQAEGKQPNLAVLDRGILEYEDDDMEDAEAGNDLYLDLVTRGIPVAVFSSDHDNLHHEEPFFSHPPSLGIYSKDPMEYNLKEVVENYKQLQKEAE